MNKKYSTDELGIFKGDLSTKKFLIYNHKYNDMYAYICPNEEVNLGNIKEDNILTIKEKATEYLKSIGIHPEVYVSTLTDNKTLLVDRKILEAVLAEFIEEF